MIESIRLMFYKIVLLQRDSGVCSNMIRKKNHIMHCGYNHSHSFLLHKRLLSALCHNVAIGLDLTEVKHDNVYGNVYRVTRTGH